MSGCTSSARAWRTRRPPPSTPSLADAALSSRPGARRASRPAPSEPGGSARQAPPSPPPPSPAHQSCALCRRSLTLRRACLRHRLVRYLSSEALAELPNVGRGFAEESTIGGAESFVMNSRRPAPHFRVSRSGRTGKKPAGRATIYDIRSAARLAAGAAAQALGDEGIKTPLLRGDESVTAAPGQRSFPTRQPGNPRRRR